MSVVVTANSSEEAHQLAKQALEQFPRISDEVGCDYAFIENRISFPGKVVDLKIEKKID